MFFQTQIFSKNCHLDKKMVVGGGWTTDDDEKFVRFLDILIFRSLCAFVAEKTIKGKLMLDWVFSPTEGRGRGRHFQTEIFSPSSR